MFHPVCWGMNMQGNNPPPLPATIDPNDYLACYELEKQVNRRQKQFISRMRPNEALILFPIGISQAMLDLEAALNGNKACPPGEIWLSDSDIVIVPKSPILRADDFIELVFTRGIYGVFPMSTSINFSKLSTL